MIERSKTELRQGKVHDVSFLPLPGAAERLALLQRSSRLWSLPVQSHDERGHSRVPIEDKSAAAVRGLNAICEVARRDYEVRHGPIDLHKGTSRDEEMDMQL